MGQGGGGTEPENVAPTAVVQVKKTTVGANQPAQFDGSGSYDDKQTPAELTYEWDFTGDGTWDATGSAVRYRYGAPGTSGSGFPSAPRCRPSHQRPIACAG